MRRWYLGIREMAIFSFPIILGQIGQMLFWVGDNWVAGRYSTEAVAALGVAGSLFAPFFLVGNGVTFAISSLMAKARGEGKNATENFGAYLWTTFCVSMGFWLLLIGLIQTLPYWGFEPAILSSLRTYLYITSFSLPGMMLFQACREYLQAFEHTLVSNGLIMLFVLINVPLDWLFMFGLGPIPEMGVTGVAIVTLSLRTLMALSILAYAIYKIPFAWSCRAGACVEMLKMGIPIGLSSFVEVSVFSLVTVITGTMSVLEAASHNVALVIASTIFYIPFAISSGASTKVARSYGEKNLGQMHFHAMCSILLVFFINLLAALLFFTVPEGFTAFMTDKSQIVKAAAGLLFFVAWFQIPDGIQVTLWGILRGMGVTKVPFIACTIAHWCIGFPIGYYLAFSREMRVSGLWIGLALGLTVYAIGLSYLYYLRLKQLKEQWV